MSNIQTMQAEYRKETELVHTKQVEKFEQMLDKNLNPITLIIGSSVMERFDWFANKTFPDHVCLLAKGGDRIEHLLWRLEHTPNSENVTKIVVQIGTNNLTRKNVTPQQIIDGCVDVVYYLRTKFPNAKITFPRLYHRGDVSDDKINKVNTGLKNILGNDFDENFWNGILPENTYDKSKYVDHVHLNKESYNSFYQKMITLI